MILTFTNVMMSFQLQSAYASISYSSIVEKNFLRSKLQPGNNSGQVKVSYSPRRPLAVHIHTQAFAGMTIQTTLLPLSR